LLEKNDRLGGNLIPGGAPDFKEDDIALANWYTHQLEKLEVEVKYNTTATKDSILAANYDVVIIATGSTPKVLPLGNDQQVLTATEVLNKEKDCGDKTVIIGGGLVGCETALWLAQQGKDVTIVEAMDNLLQNNGPLCHANSEMLEELIPYHNIEVITNATATGYKNNQLKIKVDQNEKELACDSVILAIGYQSEDSLYQELKFDIPEIYLLGDAKKVSNIMYGIWDAFEVANHI